MSSEGDIRARIKSVVEAEFAAEGWTVEDTKLLRAHGKDGLRVGVSPVRSREDPKIVVQLNVETLLQVYLPFDWEPDDTKTVDPAQIEGYGQRIRDAFRTQSSGTTSQFWGLRVSSIDYPDDPTGNKTRLEATILGYADNTATIGP